MKKVAALGLALLVGLAIGAWGIPALNAQTGGQGAYVVVETHITDPAGFMQYVQREPATLAAYHGHLLARALPDTREGGPVGGMVTLIGFASPQDANQWYNSPDYTRLAALRQHAATSRVYIISGVH